MKSTLLTRWLHWRKQWKSIVCWLLLPIIATSLFLFFSNQWQQDTKVPIGLVVEDDSPMAKELVTSIKDTPLLRVKELDIQQALLELEQHELDSVFVIQDGYQEDIQRNRRNRLITAYASDMSFAYSPVKETISSFVQQDAGRSKAAYTIQELVRSHSTDENWTWEEIVSTSKQIQEDEALLRTSFSFLGEKKSDPDNDQSIWNVWGIWSFFSILATFFLFDWVIKENQSAIRNRLSLLTIRFKDYLVRNWFLYLALFLLFDLLNIGILAIFFDETINLNLLLSILFFRLTISLGAFLLALCFHTTFLFYVSALAVSLFVSITGGALVPIDGLIRRWPWVSHLSPIQPIIDKQILSSWFIILLLVYLTWYWRKEKFHA
ncbi:ABC transporter permease [Radiobacillus kanasensis]|uniref:ABC transporter permease n=1 Tax=Radiobacillus kanasensis TaxID=2844358 RepID=UPI001E3DFC0C|nr:ABC transporter permease [Radiobacillus kanasensis]UFU00055.1 ABC transporter permease [Radiobacillus kanasensis]